MELLGDQLGFRMPRELECVLTRRTMHDVEEDVEPVPLTFALPAHIAELISTFASWASEVMAALQSVGQDSSTMLLD